jgi:hypothetical protein
MYVARSDIQFSEGIAHEYWGTPVRLVPAFLHLTS